MDQGSFGCIYRPEIECDTGNMGDNMYVSKIQKMTTTIKNEIHNGNVVKQIPHYMFWFSPILKTCPVHFSTLKKYEEEGESCKVVNDSATKQGPSTEKQFISSKIRYAGKYVIEYLNQLPPQVSIQKLILTHTYLLNALHKIKAQGMVHHDIKENNVLYDEYNHSPNIIDFGISFEIKDLGDEQKEREIFYTTKYYPYWCIQVYILCHIVHKKVDGVVSENALNVLYTEYMDSFNKYVEETNLSCVVDESTMTAHRESYWRMMKPFVGKNWYTDLRPALFKSAGNWDKFSLALVYLSMICRIESIRDKVPEVFVSSLKQQCFEVVC